jgi:hypothetical protein
MAPRMPLSVSFAQPQSGNGVAARYFANTLSRR